MTESLAVTTLGEPRLDSPLRARDEGDGAVFHFVDEAARVPLEPRAAAAQAGQASFEQAGPRERIYFDPARTRAAILTAGGLCPGLNDVIRALVLHLHYWYGVHDVLGVPYGYDGLLPGNETPPRPLTLQAVSDIHTKGGSELGSARTPPDPEAWVDTLQALGVNVLFSIGGDGTLKGLHAISEEARRRGMALAAIGIPKTIDNDIPLVYRSFGFQTAVEEADRVLDCAHVEATGARGGVGLVKLMGRHCGFIAAHATLANGDVNYCLIPEIPFRLEGEKGLLAHLRDRLRRRRHAVIVVAEGAGTELIGLSDRKDASGNRLLNDIGLYLKDEISRQFRAWGDEVHLKYFDPSYIIRSVPANSNDSIFCADLARFAVHAAMAGKTDLLIGQWHGIFTHIPLTAIIGKRKQIDPEGNLWRSVLATTGQPARWS
ncbi:MAG TPA: ATP-dependent 6-phosphofructokinase [Candidatus Sumerlaeota bacterium]|nr:ATP-dependent 6-phosphofructokinase [Candidatus Sumerlaeota bacterium]HOR26842.1 ATP-dependent 6-phosphofructokinase [Candidatus Sumerlaeota bacterium]